MTELIANNMSESTESKDSDDNILTEIVKLLECHMASGAPTINIKDAQLICSLSQAWLKMTINHCLRISQPRQNNRILHPQSSLEVGSTLGVATSALQWQEDQGIPQAQP